MHKKIIPLILSILCCCPLVSGNQPNVVLIISDDAGYADFGFMNEVTANTTDILTPELDTLRSQGSLCSVAYTGAVCSPSRGSILTGSYQQRSGYFYNINNALDPADGPDGFANNEVIAFERMKSAGYKTLAIGKWHVGAQADTLNAAGNKVVIPGNRPPRQGVDHFFGMLSGSRDYDVPMDDHAFGSYEYRQRGLREMSPGNKDDSLANDVDEEQNSKWAGDVTDAFGLRAREYVTEHANQDYPFFLYVAFNAPHTPMYESSDYALLDDPSHPNYANFNSMSTVRKKYCSMVYTMDKNIGLLMDRLKDPDNNGNTSDSVYDNTLIIFINDNGGSAKNESVNLPLRGDKGDPHDGGCRVPMIVTGPGITSGNTYDKPIHSMDLIPTMLAHGGGAIPTELMGVNLLERIKGNDNSNPHDYVCVAGNNGLGLRKGDWKLVIDGGGAQTLFNTSSDVGEANDLAASEPAKLDELIKDATNFDVQMDKPRFPSKGNSHETLNYNYSFTFAPNEVTTPGGVDKILIDYDDGDANSGEHDNAVNNGGFETNSATSGNQGKFNQINQWTNLAANGQNINAIRDNSTSPNGGGWNAVLSDANPASKDFGIDTGHSLTAGEEFTVDYAWLDASNWVDSDKIRFQLFTTNDNTITGTQNIIHTEDSSSSTNLEYKTENFTFTAPSGVDGKTLFLRFFALDGNASIGFARVDNIFVGRLGSSETQTEPQFWAGSDQWQDPSSASDTLLKTDSCALSTLVFPAESNFDYIAQNNLTRYTGLEFIQNTLSFTGNGLNSGKTARISGNDIILAQKFTNGAAPSLDLSGNGTDYTFDLALDISLYHDTVIEGDGSATYLVSGELKDYDDPVSLTKNGSSTLTLAHDATYSGNTIINGGGIEINPGVTLAGSPQVQIATNGTLSGNGTVSGSVIGTGTIDPGQSIGTLAINGDAQAGTLLIEVSSSDADRMDVTGTLDISSMDLEITSLTTPTQDAYIIASYGNINGTFASITGVPNDYQILYTYDVSGSTNHIALAKINNAPSIDAIADQDNTTLDSVNLQATASDDDTADTLTFSATGLPAGLSINPSTGVISGTISSGAETGSAYSVVVTVTDNGSPAQSAEASFTWDVVAFNNAPTITPITTQASITKDVVSLPVNASDDVGDTLTYSASGLPSGLSINNASGLIFGTISDNAAVASPYGITVTVTDNGSPTKNAQTSFTWNVSAFNNAPTITAISGQTNITKDVITGLSVVASDADGDDLTYSASGLPSGLAINSSTGSISGTIANDADSASPYSVTIIVADDGSPTKNAQTSFTWNVSAFNNAPTITAISGQTNIAKDVIAGLSVIASDADGDSLSYNASGLPSGLSISNDSGIISGTIADDAADSSPYSVTITVSDDRDPAKSAQTSFTWNVTAFNNAPTITAISGQTDTTKDVISLQVSAADSDGDTLSYSATGLPSELSIDSSSGLISGTLSDAADSAIPYNVTVTVTDNGSPAKNAETSFTWNVSAFNNAPTITAITDQTDTAKDVISLSISASDSDDDTLTYSATGLPTGLSISSSTGLISGTISDDANDSSPYNVTVTVTDNGSPNKNADASFTWNVAAFNNAPTIDAVSDQTSITKDVISLSVSASDSNSDTLSFSATGLPSGLSISSSTGLISGTLADDANVTSPYSLTITVTDDGSPNKSAQTSFTWNVAAFNNAPTISAISDQTDTAKDVISLSVSASDVDGDTLTYSATNLPTGLSIASSTGLISGTLANDADATSPYSVTIIVADDGSPAKNAETSFTWSVSTFNNAPTISAISDQTGITKDVISLQVSAADSDGDTLSYSATGLPSGLSIDLNTGLISGTISDDAGDNSSYSVTVTVTDDRAKSAQALFTWNVSTFNNAPTITAISDQTNITKDVVSIQVSALDSDDDTLSYSATGLPSELSIDSSSGLISGTLSDAANYNVTVTVTDNRALAKNAQTSFAWNVTAFNNAPTITAISDQTNITKDVVSIQVSASDSDGDTLSYSASGLPTGLSISNDSGIISGTISDDAADSSPYSVTITVSDNGSPTKNAQTSFAWNVTAFNNAPTITAISDQTNITKDVITGLSVVASDADGDSLSYNASGLPSGLSISNDSGIISGTIADDAADSSPYSVTITVSDDRDPAKSAQTSFTWNVAAFNNAPTITAISGQTNITKDVITGLSVVASDADGDSLSYNASGLPTGLTIASSTGLISGTLADDAADSSPYNVTVTVTDDGDPSKSAQSSFTWNVAAFNNAPTIDTVSDQTSITKDVISLSISASDSDDDTLTYSATGLPSGLSISSSTGLISGTLADDANDGSPYSITIAVTDNGSPNKSAQTSFTWNVAAFNNAPTITSISDQTDTAKDVISLAVSASDSDDDTLTYSATGLPGGLTIASSTGLISGTISDDADDSSPYGVTITATDDGDPAKNAQTSFTWSVAAFNNAPAITSISDQTDTAKDVISLSVSASDSDDDTLTYSATGLPGGLSISSPTGLISGALTDDAADGSPYSVTITVTDDGDPTKSADTSFTWNVAAFNNAPTINAVSDQTSITKDVISLSISASDSDGDTLSFSATGLPGGLSISSSTGLISGTLADDANDGSPYSVTITVTDNGSPNKNAQTSFTWNVSTFNNAPTITSISDQTSITKDVISLSVSASDSDDDTLAYSATGLPSGLSISSSTGLISGTLAGDVNDSSPYNVTITVTDDGDPSKSAQTSFTWNVSAFNNAPTITLISDQTSITKDVISLAVSASDSDDDTLTYSATGLPSGLSIASSTGLISGILADDAADGSPYSVTITVNDDGDPTKSAQTSLTWNVAAFNNAPTITSISDQTSITKDVISLSISASDSDDDTLTYSATGLPSGLSISSSTGLILGTISDDANDSSPYNVTITVTDNGSPNKSADTSFTWNVSAFNNAPIIDAVSDQTSITKDVISLSISASDSDDDTLTYSATDLPGGLSISSSTGLISGTLADDAADGSPYSVTITVTDNGSPNKSAQVAFTWSVSAFNNAPTIDAISDQTDTAKDVISLAVSASDSDGDTLTYSSTGLPSGLSISSSTGLISGTISDDADDSSPYSVTITVTDDGDPAKSAQTSITWNVAAFNNAPTITSISDQTSISKDVISLSVSASDSDDDALTYSATGLPSGLSIASSTGLISGTLADDAADASPYSVTITVTDDGDPAKSADTSFTWNVAAFNNAPTVTSISDQTDITKDVISLSVSASDVDSDTLTYSATGLPGGLSISSATGLISGSLADDAANGSPYNVTITVTDDGSPNKSAQTSFTWNVNIPLDSTAPTADLTSPSDGNSIDPFILNSRGYLEVTFSDIGVGLDASSIDGNELSLSGSGVGTAVINGSAPTLVSDTTYRYGFTGSFVEGTVNVTFEASSFTDFADPANLSVAETEDFTVAVSQPPPTSQIIDDGDVEYTETGWWSNPSSTPPQGRRGYQTDWRYSKSKNGVATASWTFSGLTAGSYQVSASWVEHPGRATNAPYRILDGATELATILINQQLLPSEDELEAGAERGFQHLGLPVTLTGDTLVVELSNVANGVVVADAIRIQFIEPAGPDSTAPTADLTSPSDGNSIDPFILNSRGYLEVTFSDIGVGLDASSIDGNELSLSGSGVGTAVINGSAPTLVSDTTYRYGFTGSFVEGTVNVTFEASSFTDFADPANLSVAETEDFTVAVSQPPPTSQIIDDGDVEYTETGWWSNPSSTPPQGRRGYQTDWRYSKSKNGVATASWTFSGLTAGSYQVSASWVEHPGRATNAPYRILDGATELATILINQQLLPSEDELEAGAERGFQHLGLPVTLTGDTLVVELSNVANGVVVADAIRIQFIEPAGPDSTAPTADLTSPSDGNSIDPFILNSRGYLEVTFSDIGVGLDASSIDGNELSLSGSGVGTAVINGSAPTLVSDTTYRYGFTGSFVEGTVNVTFEASSFTDFADPANLSVAETEDFTVAVSQPPPTSQIIDDGDVEYTETGWWSNPSSTPPQGRRGYQTDWRYSKSKNGVATASWTFSGLTAGSYQVSASWVEHPGRATNAPYRILDGATELATILINQQLLPSEDELEAGAERGFQHLGLPVTLTGDTLVVELSNVANGVVVADAIRIQFIEPAGPDSTAPTADLTSPSDGNSIDPFILNSRGYLEVTFSDIGVGLDASSIDGNELSLSGSGVGTAVINGSAPTLVSDTTYRYGFTGSFVEGTVNVTFEASSFTDFADPANLSVAETEDFTVAVSQPPPTSQIIDDGDVEYTETGWWSNPSSTPPQGRRGYQTDWRYSKSKNGVATASWTFSGLTAGSYQVSASWVEHPGRATNAPYRILDGATELATILINQQLLPSEDELEAGAERGFQHLGLPVTLTGDTLVVELSNVANGVVVADAIRIQFIEPAGPDSTAAKPPIEPSLTETSSITSNSYQLASSGFSSSSSSETTTTDTDGDGIPDPNDLFPNDANLTLISDYVDFIIDYITDDNAIFETDWKEPKNESDFIAKLETVLELVLAAEQAQDPEWAALLYVEALGVVEDQLIIRTDGFYGGPLDDDWIIIEEAQDIVYEDLDTLREYLWLITR